MHQASPSHLRGLHEAGFGQLFLVIHGSGWVSGADGVRRPLASGEGAFIDRGETHAKGSEAGMVAIMVQLSVLAPRARSHAG